MRALVVLASVVLLAGSAPSAQAQDLPQEIPVFPLPNVALFPGVELPLHIFETRYRAMIADALEGDRIVGMVQLRPGFESDYEGSPPVYEVGGAGTIEVADELSDGRYNIVLRGLTRFRIVDEDTSGAYRVARAEAIPEAELTDGERVRLSSRRSQLEDVLRAEGLRMGIAPELGDEEFVNALCQFVPIPAAERQRLVALDGVLERADALLELLGAFREAG